MSCFELRKFVFRCEICNKAQEIIESIGEPDLPKDWVYRSVGPCGLTNYYKKVEVCPKCAKKEEQWICEDNEDCVMSEIESIPGVWVEENRYYVAVQTKEDLYNSPINEELKNLPMEVLKNAQKFVAKRVKEILKKGK